jgi:hypothetical protein
MKEFAGASFEKLKIKESGDFKVLLNGDDECNKDSA